MHRQELVAREATLFISHPKQVAIMPSSSDGDDSDASPPIVSTQYSAIDDELDIGNTLRQRREASRRQRLQDIERRREERKREAEERRRRQMRVNDKKSKRKANNDDDDDDASLSSSGSADLLAEASPLPSPSPSPSPPPPGSSPLRTSRISNRSRKPPNITGSNANGRPLSSASAKVNSKTASSKYGDSPSSILKKRNGVFGASSPSPSPNRVAFSRVAASRRHSDSDDDEGKNTNNLKAAGSPAQQTKRWKPKYADSDSSDDDKVDSKVESRRSSNSQKKANEANASSSLAQSQNRWKPKYASDSSDGEKVNDREEMSQNARINNPIESTKQPATKKVSSPPQKKKPPLKSKYAYSESSSDDEDDEAIKEEMARRLRERNSNNTMSTSNNNLAPVTKAKAERPMPARKTTAKRFGFESSSDEGDLEGEMRRAMWEKTKAKPIAVQKSSWKAGGRPTLAPSPAKKAGAAVPKRSLLASLTQDTDSDDDDDDDFAEKARRTFQERAARREAEERARKEAMYKHNPLALEKREREERDEQRMHSDKYANEKTNVARSPGLEGTEIAVDGAEIESVSEFGDDNRDARGSATKRGSGGGEFLPRKPSRGTYKRRTAGADDSSNDEDDGTPSKKQRFSNQPSPNKGLMQDTEDDGLWDDSEVDEKKNDVDDSDSDAGGKGKRGRGRTRGSRGSGTQPRKRSRSKAVSNAASKTADSNDDDSDAPTQKKKGPAKKNGRQRRRSSSIDSADDNAGPKKRSSGGTAGSRWASRYSLDAEENVSEDEKERLERQLKPDFADPKLGPPGPLVPFVLSKKWRRGDPLIGEDAEDGGEEGVDDGNRKMPAAPINTDGDVDQVPASINRYLQRYQREGIQFIYSSVIHGKGCVLGDDMGLGKTVQLISLIAALLKKTGTGLDQIAIKEHGNKVKKMLIARDESKRQALLTGFGIKNESALDTAELPPFTPILIIVPSSVVENWQNEFKTWGHFNVGVYHGATREKALDRVKDGLDYILIAGKSLFTRAADYDQLATVQWKLIIVDEFHEFKNGKSQGYMRLADIRDNSSGCPIVGMTGTLMQNRHDELFYLMDLVRPNMLGCWETFRDEISKPITYARAKDAKEEVRRIAEQQERVLRRAMEPAYLERKKEDVLKDSLTQKKEKVVFCELSEIQKKLYRHIISLPDYHQLRFANAPCDCGVNKSYFRGYKKMRTHKEQLNYQRRHKNELVPKKKCCFKYPWHPDRGEPGVPEIDPDAIIWIQMHEKAIGNPDDIDEDIIDGKYVVCQNCPMCTSLAAMNKLYKVSSHPCLIQVDHCESGLDAKKKLDFAKAALTPEILRELPGGTYWKSDGIMDDHIALSGKMKTLDYLLRKYLKRQNRVLIFSYSTATLDMIQNHIKCQGWTHLRLDGQTPTSQRQSLVDKFQHGEMEIFLISTKAGGLGLNLTAANKVIIFDVNWNPSYDEQAQDRAYRIGQKRDVDTVRLVARGTIEELIYARQVYKVQLKKQTLGHNIDGKNQPQIFRGVAKDKNRKGELFGLENLLKFKDGSFMSSLWKKADNPNEEHDMADLAKELESIDEDQLDNLAEEGDEGPKDSRGNAQKPIRGNNESDDDDSDMIANGINHGDYFANDKGGAKVAQGDDDFNEEMGGLSQIVEATTKLACENIKSDEEEDDDEEVDDNEPTPPDYVPPDLKLTLNEAEEGDGDEDSKVSEEDGYNSPVKSSANENVRDTHVSLLSSPAKSSINLRGETDSGNKMSPDQSTSSHEADGLRTQPTQTPKVMAAHPKKGAAPKISLMGTVFETKKKNKDLLSKKKTGGLYLPSYSRKS